MTVPEVERVFGKMGRAETATDPAPLEMVETTVRFKPRDQWRPGMTTEKLIEELDRTLTLPGLANVWVPPIRNRIDMLATGIKSPVGVKVAGTDPAVIDQVAQQIEQAVRNVPGVTSALAERLTGGRYIEVDIDRDAAARYGMNIDDVQSVIYRGHRRRDDRRDGRGAAALSDQRALSARAARFAVGSRTAADRHARRAHRSRSGPWRICASPAARRCFAARTRGCRAGCMSIFAGAICNRRSRICRRGRARDVKSARRLLDLLVRAVRVPGACPGEASKIVVPFTLLVIFVLLYLTFRRIDEALLIMATLPFAVIGGFWFIYLLGHDVSIATAVGFIALAGRCRRVRRRDADLPEAGLGRASGRPAERRPSSCSMRRFARAPCCACGRRR